MLLPYYPLQIFLLSSKTIQLLNKFYGRDLLFLLELSKDKNKKVVQRSLIQRLKSYYLTPRKDFLIMDSKDKKKTKRGWRKDTYKKVSSNKVNLQNLNQKSKSTRGQRGQKRPSRGQVHRSSRRGTRRGRGSMRGTQ